MGKDKAQDKCCITMVLIIKGCGKTIIEMVWVYQSNKTVIFMKAISKTTFVKVKER